MRLSEGNPKAINAFLVPGNVCSTVSFDFLHQVQLGTVVGVVGLVEVVDDEDLMLGEVVLVEGWITRFEVEVDD